MVKLLRIAVLVIGSAAAATANSLILDPAPDVMAAFLGVSYDVNTGYLTAAGFADSLTVFESGIPVLYGIPLGSFLLTAQINSLGVASSGTLAIDGCISALLDAPGCSSSLLLSAELNFFEFEPVIGGEVIFGFTSLTGDLQPRFGNQAFVKMNLTEFPGGFENSFSTSDFSDVADVGTVTTPEPGTMSLLLVPGFFAFVWGQRRRYVSRRPSTIA